MKIKVHSIPARSCKSKGRATAIVVAEAVVDDEARSLIEAHFWTLGKDGYPRTREHGHNILMHHLILPAIDGADVSHINGNKLDNRRTNLEYATRSRNMLNTADPLSSANSSGFRGVTRDDRSRGLSRPWRGKVTVAGKTHQTRRCATREEAAMLLNDLRKGLGVQIDPRVREFPKVHEVER